MEPVLLKKRIPSITIDLTTQPNHARINQDDQVLLVKKDFEELLSQIPYDVLEDHLKRRREENREYLKWR